MELQDWKRKSLNDLFNAGVARNPTQAAVVYDDGQYSSCLNYAQLRASSMAVTDELKCNHKCEDEIIGVLVKPGLLLPAVLLGILGVPAAFYTLSVELSAPARIKNIFERLGIRILVTDSQELVDGLKAKIFRGCSMTVRHLNILDHELLIVTLNGASQLSNERASSGFALAYAITTSGTTGIPKIVKVPHQCIVPNILHLSDIYSLTGADTVLQASPMTFDPSIVEIFTTFFSGATLLMVPDSLKLQPRNLASFSVERNKVTVLQATPSLMSGIASCGVLSSTLLSAKSSLRLLVFGGESCPGGRILESWREPGNRTRFINLYGVTEVSSWATFYELTEEEIQLHSEDVPLGSTLLGTELEIRDIDGDSVGQLWIGGEERVCVINDETSISGRCMRFSGDYVRQMLTGSLLYVGRKDDMVKRNGRRLHLHEIEKVFSRAVGINRCIAIYERNRLILFVQPSLINDKKSAEEEAHKRRQCSLNDADSEPRSSMIDGQIVSDEEAKGFAVPRKMNGGNGETQAEIEQKLLVIINELKDGWLPYFSHPDDVQFVWDLPLTSHGKVDKRRLIDMYSKWNGIAASTPRLITEVDISDRLTRIWKKYITTEVPDAKSFVESGGNSVTAVAMTEDIHRLFDVDSASLLDIVLHGTLQNVISHVTLAFQLTDRSTELNDEHGSDAGVAPDVPRVLPRCKNNLVNLESRNRKHATAADLPPGKRIRQDNVEDRIDSFPLENVLDCSTGRVSVGIDGMVSIQRGSRTFYHQDFVEPNMSTAEPNMSIAESNMSIAEPNMSIAESNISIAEPNMSIAEPNMSIAEPNMSIAEPNVSIAETSMSTTPWINEAEPTLEMEVCWKYDTGKCVDASPLIVSLRNGEKVIYIGSHSHRFVALNVATGSVVWEVTLGDRIESSACLSHCARHVIVGCYDGKVYFLERLTGRQHWTFQTESQVKSSPSINATNGLVYIGSHDYHLYALNAQMRSCVWKVDLGAASIFSSPVLNMHAYEVVVATLGGRLVSLHPDTGDVLWEFNAGKPIFSSVTYTECRYVVGCVDGTVYCVGRDGKKIWSYTTKGAVFSSPCVSDVTFPKHSSPQAQDVLPDTSSLPSTFASKKMKDSPNNPQQLFQHDSFENKPSEKAHQKVITIGSHDCKVYCLHASDGHLLWSKTLDSAVFSTPFSFSLQQTRPLSSRTQLTDFSSQVTNAVAVCGSKGVLYILDSASGIVRGEFQFPGELFSSPCVLGDRLILGCRDNFVYCIKFCGFL